MATISSLGSSFTTTAGTKTVTATPALNDLIVLVTAHTGYTATTAPTDNNTDGNGTYTLITSAAKASSADTLFMWVRNSLIGSASSTVFTGAGTGSTGGGLQVFKVTGMTLAGAGGIRQSAIQANHASGSAPAPVFGVAALTGNVTLGAVFNATSPATMTPRTSWTESIDLGYSTPTAGLETMFRNGGETATTQTWGSSSASAFSSIVVELDTTSVIPPTITNLQQYDGDGVTALAVGDYAPTGISTGVNLEFDMVPYKETIDTNILDAKVEVRAVGTSFTNAATTTALDTYYDPDEPIGLRGAAFAYDTIRKRYILTFGANGSTSHNEVWQLRFIGGRAKWKQLFPTGTAPTVRYQGGAAFDATNNRFFAVFGFTTVDTNEVWQISFASSADGAWLLTTPTGTAPTARSNVTQTVCNDPTNNCFYVVTGWGASFFNGVYKYDYSTSTPAWSTLAAENAAGAPTGRRNANAILDTPNNRILVTMGNINSTTGTQNDLHAFALSGNTWSTLTPTGGPPSVRERAWSYYDPLQQCGVFAMGDNDNTAAPIQDMWKLDTTTTNCTWSQIDRAQDNTGFMMTGMYLCNAQWNPDMSCGTIWAGGVDITADLQHHVLIVDSADMTNSRVDIYGAMYNHNMRPMDATSVVYNSDAQEAVTVGGFSQMQDNTTPGLGGHITDVFAYSYTNNEWRVASKGWYSFPHREGMCAVYDTVGQRILAFGGLWGAGATNKGTFCDVWEIKRDINGNYGIRRMAPTGTPPGARWLGAAAYDSSRNRLLITMGSNGGTANFNDLLQLDLNTYDNTYDSSTQLCNIYGGTGGTGSGEIAQAAGQSFTANSNYILNRIELKLIQSGSPTDNLILTLMTGSMTGTVVATSNAVAATSAPTANPDYVPFTFPGVVNITSGTVYYAALTRSGARDTTNKVIACGNTTGALSGGDCYTEGEQTWTNATPKDLAIKVITSDVSDGAWTTLSPLGTPPTGAWGVSFANDTANKILYIFGGATSALDTTYVNTFSKINYSTTACAWTALSSTGALTARRSANIAVDHTNNKVIAFGGYNGTVVEQDLNFYDITGNTWGTTGTPGTSPGARRSHGGWYDPNNSVYLITHGRTVSSAWWSDTWQLTPNYTTPASSTWVNQNPSHYIRGNTLATYPSNAYHWQAWATDATATTDSALVSYGGNLETVTDFTTAYGINVDPSNLVYIKPNLQITVI